MSYINSPFLFCSSQSALLSQLLARGNKMGIYDRVLDSQHSLN